MPRRYYISRPLSAEEQQELEELLLEQMEIQRWYAVEVVAELGAEIVIPLN
ncbi:MAG TPA: hypothetical protein VMM57_12220 [Bacteroidota bacterium]|nr:hypothetical protein [Bacteroidota bacterium]